MNALNLFSRMKQVLESLVYILMCSVAQRFLINHAPRLPNYLGICNILKTDVCLFLFVEISFTKSHMRGVFQFVDKQSGEEFPVTVRQAS